jgi:sugar/nucleoside kinase (ribokinase family)
MDSLAIDALLITEGESGMPSFERRDSAVHLAAARVVYDVTGAGDVVIATLALALGVLLCERQPISPIWLGASRLSRSELPRLSCRRSYSDVQIAVGIQ